MSKNDINTKKYINEISKLSLTDERKKEIMSKIKEEANENNMINFSKVGKIGIAVALICVMTTVTAYATGILKKPSDIFTPILGVQTEQIAHIDLIDKIGKSIGIASTSNGVTITLDGIIGDESVAYVVYTLTNEDGSKIELPKGLEASNIDSQPFEGTSIPRKVEDCIIGHKMIINENDDLQYIETFNFLGDELPIGEIFSSKFTKFSDWDNTFVIEGNWKFKYPFEYDFEYDSKDTNIFIDVNESYTVFDERFNDNLTYTIEDIRISPLSISLNWSCDTVPIPIEVPIVDIKDIDISIVDSSDGNNETSQEMIFIMLETEVYIHEKNGNKTQIRLGGKGWHDDEKSYGEGVAVLDKIILLEDIKEIQIGDIFVPID